MLPSREHRLFKLRLDSLMRKLHKLSQIVPAETALFVKVNGKLYSFQSNIKWPCSPSTIENVTVDPEEQVTPVQLDSPKELKHRIATLESQLALYQACNSLPSIQNMIPRDGRNAAGNHPDDHKISERLEIEM
jgi:hypothetical protein